MHATPAAIPKQTQKGPAPSSKTAVASPGQPTIVEEEKNSSIRLHITPFTPALLKLYIPSSTLPFAKNISYHNLETFPEKGFGYVELPTMEAAKLKKKLNGSTLRGSKVRIEEAKPEKRKAGEDAEDEEVKKVKRVKKEKTKKDQGVLEGIELPTGRKVKRGWTEPLAKNRKDKKDKKDKTKRKDSKYTREPELLFNAKLIPVAATEVVRKEKSKAKKEKKARNRSKSTEVTVHEFEQNSKTPSFLKSTQVSTEAKPAVEYVNGQGWVDEDGNVVEPETGKVRNRRVLELVDTTAPTSTIARKPSTTPEAGSSPKSTPKPAKKPKKQTTPPPSSSESESDAEESSVVSSSSEDSASDPNAESNTDSDAISSASSPAVAPGAPQIDVTPSSPEEKKDVHPLESIFKRPKPTSIALPPNPTSTPSKGLAPINTSFSFFDNQTDAMDVEPDASGNAPATPYTQRDLEWRGLRSAAPTPDTAAIGRRFSFPWRNSSQEADDNDEDEEDAEAGKQLSNNTKANIAVAHLPGVAEEDEEMDAEAGHEDDNDEDELHDSPVGARTRRATKQDDDEKEETEFGKWFWENRGDNNRAWKKRRRETLKAKRLRDNRKLTVEERSNTERVRQTRKLYARSLKTTMQE